MLPDLRSLKVDFNHYLNSHLQARIQRDMGVFGKAARHVIHEGDRLRVVRADGSSHESVPEAAEASVTLDLSRVPELSLADTHALLDTVAVSMAEGIQRNCVAAIHECLDSAGRVSREGRPLDAEAILAALEMVDVDFDESGRAHDLTIMIPPALQEQASKAIAQFEDDEGLKSRFEQLLSRKRQDWYAREARRELAG